MHLEMFFRTVLFILCILKGIRTYYSLAENELFRNLLSVMAEETDDSSNIVACPTPEAPVAATGDEPSDGRRYVVPWPGHKYHIFLDGTDQVICSHSDGKLHICDADEEYRPDEIPMLLQPVLDGETNLVYGTRAFSSHTSFSYWYVIGNKGVNTITNVLFNSYVSDVETCFKLMPLSLYRSLDITEKGFGMEAEVTAKLLARGVAQGAIPEADS